MTPPLIALDFDGVVVDSVDECVVVAYNAYRSMADPDATRVLGLRDVPERVTAWIRRHRYLLNHGSEYWAVLHALERGLALDEQSYPALRDTHQSDLGRFDVVFAREREWLRQRDPRGWFALHRAYAEVGAWQALRAIGDVCIVTKKDAASVESLLSFLHLPLAPVNIHSVSAAVSKAEVLQELLRARGQDNAACVFVDDYVGHLEQVRAVGINVIWAHWGYVPPLLSGADGVSSFSELPGVVAKLLAGR